MDEKVLREEIGRGHDARRAGRLEEALRHYRRALELSPRDAEANSLCGLVLLHLGQPAEAEPALRIAVQTDPANFGYRMNLAELFERQNKIRETVAELREVTAIAPGFPRAWERLGDLSARSGQAADALHYYKQAAALDPISPGILVKLASIALRLGNVGEARRIADRLQRAAPENPAIFHLCVEVFTAQLDWRALERLGTVKANADPNDPTGWQALTTAMFETGRMREAMELYRRVIEHSPRDAARLTAYAQYCLNVSEFPVAESALDEAETFDPDYVEMLSAKALLLTYLGRFDKAEAYARRCIALAPTHAPAYRVLNHLKRGKLSDEEQSALAKLASRENPRPAERVAAAYSLADCLDAKGDFDAAFAAYEYANGLSIEQIKRETLDYDRSQRRAWIDGLIDEFRSSKAKMPDEFGPIPIFIVGMPRSGTTLVESVLAAHSRVFGCGERTVMPQILVNYLLEAKKAGRSDIAAEQWENWVRAYWYELPDASGADHITDKNPFNFESVGLIAQMFPRVKIVNVRRSPIETGLSIFRNQFPKFVAFANRLEDIGHYYGEYARLVAHWEKVLDERFITVQYETFVSDFDASAPALVAACGLEWEEACRHFDKSERPIATLSAVQVRESIGSSDGRARHYERHLKPLIDALEAAGVDLKTGALRA